MFSMRTATELSRYKKSRSNPKPPRLPVYGGGIDDLIGSPIVVAEEVVHDQDVNPEGVIVPEYQDSFTWTFYKLDTAKGGVTIRWYGDSNGYYSESVDFERVK